MSQSRTRRPDLVKQYSQELWTAIHFWCGRRLKITRLAWCFRECNKKSYELFDIQIALLHDLCLRKSYNHPSHHPRKRIWVPSHELAKELSLGTKWMNDRSISRFQDTLQARQWWSEHTLCQTVLFSSTPCYTTTMYSHALPPFSPLEAFLFEIDIISFLLSIIFPLQVNRSTDWLYITTSTTETTYPDQFGSNNQSRVWVFFLPGFCEVTVSLSTSDCSWRRSRTVRVHLPKYLHTYAEATSEFHFLHAIHKWARCHAIERV